MLEVRHLRTLIALAEAGTVSRAAERVHLTQSALSHQLKALESHYGLAMVKRHGQSVQLTEPARRLVALGHTVMNEVQTAERARMPHLLRLADADHGRFSQALAGGGARSRIGLSPQSARLARRQQDRSCDRSGEPSAAG